MKKYYSSFYFPSVERHLESKERKIAKASKVLDDVFAGNFSLTDGVKKVSEKSEEFDKLFQ